MKDNTINAARLLIKLEDMLKRAEPAVTHYQDVFNDPDIPRIHPEVDQFYKTFDNSIIQVVNYRDPRNPRARAVVLESSEDFDDLGAALQQSIQDVVGGFMHDAEEDDLTEGKPVEEGRQYMCQIVKGGHQLERFPGSHPGSNYVINSQGLTLFVDQAAADDQELDNTINLGYLSMVGLSLREKVSVNFG